MNASFSSKYVSIISILLLLRGDFDGEKWWDPNTLPKARSPKFSTEEIHKQCP